MRSHAAAARRILQVLILIALAGGAAYWHWGLLPGSLRDLPIDAIRTATGFEADFRRVHYVPFYGIRIDEPVLKGKNGQELFRARGIRLVTDLPAFFQEDRIVIQKIEVDSPVTEFRLGGPDKAGAQGQDAGSADPDAPVPLDNPVPHPFVVLEAIFDDSFLPSNVYLNELEIHHGRISILRPEGGAPVETLKEIRFRTLLDRRPLIPVEARFRTGFGRGDFKMEGLVNLADGRHRLSLEGNIDRLPLWLISPLAKWRVRADRLRGDAALTLNYDGASLIAFQLDSRKMSGQAHWGERGVSGSFAVKTSGTFDFGTRKLDFANGLVEAAGVTVRNAAPQLAEVRLSSAAVAWNPELIEIPRIQGSWEGTNFTIEGTMDRAEGRATKLKFRQTLESLEPLKTLMPKVFDHPLNPGSLNGKIGIEASMEGAPSELLKNIHTVRLDIREGSLAPKTLKSPVTGIAGSVLIDRLKVFSADDLFFRHAGNDYTLSGQFNTAPGGAGRFNIATRKWEAGARFKSFPDRLEFSTLTVESGMSHAGGSGTLLLGKRLVVNADFRAHLAPEQLAADWKISAPWLADLKLRGIIDAKGSIQGPLQEFTGLKMRVEAKSSRLAYSDLFVFTPIETDLRLDSGMLEILYAKAGFYGGEARATGRADLTDLKRPYFETHVFTQDTDLEEFSRNLSFIKNKFSGTLNLDLVLSGLMNDPKSLEGHGTFRVTNGEIWQTELFKRLKKFAFVTIEGADNVIFNSANGSFTVRGGGLETQDCTLSSKLIDVHFTGRIGFDATLALNVVSRFTSGIIREASEVGGLTPALINIAENKITRYLITGTFKDPSFTPQS
jgi:hypothetical protein